MAKRKPTRSRRAVIDFPLRPGLSGIESQLIHHYRQLDDVAQRKISELAELFIESHEPPKNVIDFAAYRREHALTD
jgi:hypothetical protein